MKISLGCCDGVTFHIGRSLPTTICSGSPYYRLSTALGTGLAYLCMLTNYINGQFQLTLVRTKPQGHLVPGCLSTKMKSDHPHFNNRCDETFLYVLCATFR